MAPDERFEQSIGAVLPDFALACVRPPHEAWRLHEMAARGRGAVLVFWSSVCSHCARYDQYLNSLPDRHPELACVGIASRQGETADEVRAALVARNLAFPMVYDTGGALAHRLFTQQTPRAFLVDADSRLVYRGAIDNFKYPDDSGYEPYLEPAIESLLAGRSVVRSETPSFGCPITSIYYSIPRPLKKV